MNLPLVLHVVITTGVLLYEHVGCVSNPSRKAWWTKRIASDDYHTAGRLTSRQIKYTHESGFKTIISLFTFDNENGETTALDEKYLPSSDEARQIAENLTGIHFDVVISSDNADEITERALEKLNQIIRVHPKPVLIHCEDSYYSTFSLLLHFANVTEKDDNQDGEPSVTFDEVFDVGSTLGYDFGRDMKLKTLVEKLAKRKIPETSKPNVVDPDWYKKYWLMKPVYRNWFVAGQFQSSHLSDINKTGLKSIVNLRKGLTSPIDGSPAQEEVSLLNIKGNTGTYTGNGRQSETELRKNRIDPLKPNVYISPISQKNYESRNPLEFGDDIGYSEPLNKRAVASQLPNVSYIHLPVAYDYSKTTIWDDYKSELRIAWESGPVLVSCRIGYRAAVLAILYVAYENCLSSEWALKRGEEMGYALVDTVPDVLPLYQAVLDDGICDRDNNKNRGNSVLPERMTSMWLMIIIYSMLNVERFI